MRKALSLASLLCFALAAFPQTATAPTFDVASIKPSTQDWGSYVRFLPGGRLSAMSWMAQLIQIAYGLHAYQITGGPGWLNTARYTIEAKAASPDTAQPEMKLMLQSLLADRFKLQFHWDTKEFPIYNLVADKSGPRLTPLKPGESSRCARDNSAVCGIRTTAGLASFLQAVTGRPVFDTTGSDGNYDILIDFDIYLASGRTPPPDFDKPSLTDALHDQLGLHLEPAKTTLPILIIDTIQRPTEN